MDLSENDDIFKPNLDAGCSEDSTDTLDWTNNCMLANQTLAYRQQFGSSFVPGPIRSPKRRGRPIANNAARERSRVKTLRSAFLDLQRTLPAVPPDTKLSKLDVLVLATTYIAHLMSTLADDRDISQVFAANGCMHPVKYSNSSDSSTTSYFSFTRTVGKGSEAKNGNLEDVVGNLFWSELESNDEGRVTVNELGRCLRQHGVDVSNFMILRILSDGTLPQLTMDHDEFVRTKEKLIQELKSTEPMSADDKLKKNRAHYLDLWKEHSQSKDDSGEIPISNLPDVIFSECNPTKELLSALIGLKSDGSESINFEEFCDMLDNLPQSGMISEEMLLKAFRTEDIDGSGFLTRPQLYSLLIENGSDPLKKEEVDDMMEDCGFGDKFSYTDWIQRVITMKTQSEN